MRKFRSFAFQLTLVTVTVGCGMNTITAIAEPAGRQQHQVPGFYRMNLGEFEITALYDGFIKLDPAWLSGISADNIQSLLAKMFIDSSKGIQNAVNGYLINTGEHPVLVDAGSAQCFGSTLGVMRRNLEASGYQVEQMDSVLLTHLHPDHACGLANADGTPTYPNARVYMPRQEAEFWLDQDIAAMPEPSQAFFLMARAAVAPYAQERLLRYEPDAALLPGVESVPTYGHTPGHSAYLFTSGDERLIVWGNLVHNHAIQFARPEVVIEFDADSAQARSSRQSMLTNAAKEHFWVAGAHLPFPGLGRVRATDGAYAWVPVEFGPVGDHP